MPASLVQWKNARLPRGRPGFDSRTMQSVFSSFKEKNPCLHFERILYAFFLPPHLAVIFERAQLAHYCMDIYFFNADGEYICPPFTENEKNNMRKIISIYETSCRGISSDGRALA